MEGVGGIISHAGAFVIDRTRLPQLQSLELPLVIELNEAAALLQSPDFNLNLSDTSSACASERIVDTLRALDASQADNGSARLQVPCMRQPLSGV